jgi:hypothetical protein
LNRLANARRLSRHPFPVFLAVKARATPPRAAAPSRVIKIALGKVLLF